MNKYIPIFLFVVAIVLGALAYSTFFTPKERRARYIRNNQDKIVKGMTDAMVRELLSRPDTTYIYDLSMERTDDTIIVLEYYRGFGSADNLRVLTKDGLVVEIISNR